MKPVEKTGADLDALVELVYAETGAPDVDKARVAAAATLFEDDCSGCHTRTAGETTEAAPSLAGRGSADYIAALIANRATRGSSRSATRCPPSTSSTPRTAARSPRGSSGCARRSPPTSRRSASSRSV